MKLTVGYSKTRKLLFHPIAGAILVFVLTLFVISLALPAEIGSIPPLLAFPTAGAILMYVYQVSIRRNSKRFEDPLNTQYVTERAELINNTITIRAREIRLDSFEKAIEYTGRRTRAILLEKERFEQVQRLYTVRVVIVRAEGDPNSVTERQYESVRSMIAQRLEPRELDSEVVFRYRSDDVNLIDERYRSDQG